MCRNFIKVFFFVIFKTPPANAYRRVEHSSFGTVPRRSPHNSAQLSTFSNGGALSLVSSHPDGPSIQQNSSKHGNSLSSGNINVISSNGNNGSYNQSTTCRVATQKNTVLLVRSNSLKHPKVGDSTEFAANNNQFYCAPLYYPPPPPSQSLPRDKSLSFRVGRRSSIDHSGLGGGGQLSLPMRKQSVSFCAINSSSSSAHYSTSAPNLGLSSIPLVCLSR